MEIVEQPRRLSLQVSASRRPVAMRSLRLVVLAGCVLLLVGRSACEDHQPPTLAAQFVQDRGLVTQAFTYADVVHHHKRHCQDTTHKHFPGETLGYVTPWNNRKMRRWCGHHPYRRCDLWRVQTATTSPRSTTRDSLTCRPFGCKFDDLRVVVCTSRAHTTLTRRGYSRCGRATITPTHAH